MPKTKLTTQTARKKIKDYFDNCDPHIETVELVIHDKLKDGTRNPVGKIKKVPTKTKQRPYTVSGLAYALGLTTKEFRSLTEPNYKKKKGMPTMSPGVRKLLIEALQKVEEYAEKQLYSGKASGAQFALKNIGEWKDKFEHDSPGLSNAVSELEGVIAKALKK